MANNNINNKASMNNDIFSANDALDINELAALNDDISPEFIEQLQSKLSIEASQFSGKPIGENNTIDDIELFEEIPEEAPKISESSEIEPQEEFIINEDIPENKPSDITKVEISVESSEEIPVTTEEFQNKTNDNIENLTSGNIIEKPITQAQIEYNEKLDYLDENKKYTKYVIYVDQENTEFIDSLTVKERKNLINRILKEQDAIALTKRRLSLIQTIIKHVIIAIITVAIAIPTVYWTINASLEASINNYRRSKTIFKSLYKEKGKIKSHKTH